MLWSMETANANLKEIWILSLQRWYYDPRKRDTQSLRVPAPWLVESWEEWEEKKPFFHCGCFEHKTFIPDHSLSKSAQYPRSSFRLEWTAWSKVRRTEKTEPMSEKFMTNKDSVNPEMLKSVDSQEVSKLFGRFFKVGTCFWKQIARWSSEF